MDLSQSSISTPSRATWMAPFGQVRAMRSTVSSSGSVAAGSMVASSSSSNRNSPGAVAMQRPALTHSDWSIHTCSPGVSAMFARIVAEVAA